MKKIYHKIAVLALALPIIAQSENLVVDNGFELQGQSWNIVWRSNITSDASNVFEGDNAVQVGDGSLPGSAEQIIYGLSPNTTYQLKAVGRTDNNSVILTLGVKDYGGNELTSTTTEQIFKQLSLTFTTGATNSSATIYGYKPSGTGYAYADNFQLSEVLTDFVINGDIESGSNSWNISWYGAINSDSENSIAGNRSLKVGTQFGVGSAEQVISGLSPNTTYKLSGFIKTDDSGANVYLGVKNHGASEIAKATNSTKFVNENVLFKTGQTNTSATIYVYKSSGVGFGYGDNISVVEQKAKCISSGNTTYYLDADNGNDDNSGDSPSQAWQTLSKVNNCQFAAGDQLLLDANDSWIGTLSPKGSGKPGNLFTIGKYGTTSEIVRPIINGNGALRSVYLSNQEYVHIRDLEIINSASPDSKKRGIEVENIDSGTLHDIYITNNYVHDIDGDNTKDLNGSAGIMVTVRKGTNPIQSNYDGIYIEDNAVVRVDRTGINISNAWWCRTQAGCNEAQAYTASTNVRVANNYVEDAGGDGIVPINTINAVVEYNMVNGAAINSGAPNAGIWAWNADNTLFQFNEAYNVKFTKDGQGFDVDYGQDGTIFQYNYSHDNEGGFMLVATSPFGSTTNAIIRYNVSQNDHARVFELLGRADGVDIYNNSVYLPAGSTTKPIHIGAWGTNNYPSNVRFYNNIFHLDGAGNWEGLNNVGGEFIFENNIVYGVHTSGEPASAINVNPMYVSPGGASSGFFSNDNITFGNIDAYKLQSGSPAIGVGSIINSAPSVDYWGNPISAVSPPNIGAYNGSGE